MLQFTENGTFPLACRVADHVAAGTIVYMHVGGDTDFDANVVSDSTTREYWIRAGGLDVNFIATHPELLRCKSAWQMQWESAAFKALSICD